MKVMTPLLQPHSCSWEGNKCNLFVKHLRLCTTRQCPECKQFLMPTHWHRQMGVCCVTACYIHTLKMDTGRKQQVGILYMLTPICNKSGPNFWRFLDCLWVMSCFLSLFIPLIWNFTALHPSRSRMCTMPVASACHMGHTNRNHEHVCASWM
jgi:hypothetical protein